MGREEEKEGSERGKEGERRERRGEKKRVPSAQNFPLSVHSQFPALFQISLP